MLQATEVMREKIATLKKAAGETATCCAALGFVCLAIGIALGAGAFMFLGPFAIGACVIGAAVLGTMSFTAFKNQQYYAAEEGKLKKLSDDLSEVNTCLEET